jgi:hypothetical protein
MKIYECELFLAERTVFINLTPLLKYLHNLKKFEYKFFFAATAIK